VDAAAPAGGLAHERPEAVVLVTARGAAGEVGAHPRHPGLRVSDFGLVGALALSRRASAHAVRS
jgi:hypothetical protein